MIRKKVDQFLLSWTIGSENVIFNFESRFLLCPKKEIPKVEKLKVNKFALVIKIQFEKLTEKNGTFNFRVFLFI